MPTSLYSFLRLGARMTLKLAIICPIEHYAGVLPFLVFLIVASVFIMRTIRDMLKGLVVVIVFMDYPFVLYMNNCVFV